MKLSDDEYEVVTNHWGNTVPDDLEEIETQQLLEMLVHVSRAVGASIQDGDADALEVLEPLEEKLESMLTERVVAG